MADMPHPVFDRILVSGSDPADQTITVVFGVADGTGVRLDMTLAVVGALQGILAAEAHSLNAGIPLEDRASVPLSCDHISITQTSTGSPVLVLGLVSGSILPLELKSGDLAGLSAELALLSAPDDGSPPN